MIDIKSLFTKKTSGEAPEESRKEIVAIRNWYEERYDTVLVQRNLLVILLSVCLIAIVLSIISVTKIATSKQFDPFVIQIDENTGSAKVVTPISEDVLSRDESLTRYFLKKYISSRESYNPVDFSTIAQKTVCVFSSSSVFWGYRSFINDKDTNPVTKYGQNNTTYITIKSWSKLEEKKYVIRFAVHESSGEMRVYNKIAIVDIDYVSMELKDDEREINPVGLQITGYRVDDDNS